MRRPKYTWRIMPFRAWEFAETEAWLEEQAARGLRLHHLNLFAVFECVPPEKRRYHLEPGGASMTDKLQASEKERGFFAELGWTYVDATRSGFRIYTSGGEGAAFHTDPVVQAAALARAEAVARKELLGNVAGLAFLVMLWLLSMFTKEDRYVKLMEVSYEPWLLVYFVLLLVPMAVRWRRVRQMRKRLQAGDSLPPARDWRKAVRHGWAQRFAFIAGCVLLFACIFAGASQRVAPAPVPSLRIASIGGDAGDMETLTQKTLLASQIVFQNENNTQGLLTTRYYRLRSAQLAEPLMESLLASRIQTEWGTLSNKREELALPPFTRAVLVTLGPNYKHFAAYWDDAVVMVSYLGEGPFEERLPEIARAAAAWREGDTA